MRIKDIIENTPAEENARRTKLVTDFISAVRRHQTIDPKVVSDTISIFVSNKDLSGPDEAYSIAKARNAKKDDKTPDNKKPSKDASMNWEPTVPQKKTSGWSDRTHGHLRFKKDDELDLTKSVASNIRRGERMGTNIGKTIAKTIQGTGPIKRGFDV